MSRRITADTITLFPRGKRLTREELAPYPVRAAGTGLPDENGVYAFGSRRAFNEWVKRTKLADRVSRANRLIREARKHETQDNTAAIERQKAVVDRITNDLTDLSRRTGLAPTSKELFLRGTLERHPLEGSIFDPVILFDQVNGQSLHGRFLPLLAIPMPNLRWFNFDNCASGALVIAGGTLLFDRTWFRGGVCLLVALPYGVYDLRDDFGFDNIASSCVVV